MQATGASERPSEAASTGEPIHNAPVAAQEKVPVAGNELEDFLDAAGYQPASTSCPQLHSTSTKRPSADSASAEDTQPPEKVQRLPEEGGDGASPVGSPATDAGSDLPRVAAVVQKVFDLKKYSILARTAGVLSFALLLKQRCFIVTRAMNIVVNCTSQKQCESYSALSICMLFNLAMAMQVSQLKMASLTR